MTYGSGHRHRAPPKTRKCRATGFKVTVGHAEDLGLDPDGGNWYVLCEEHGSVCNFETRAAADRHAPEPAWCEDCQPKLYPKKEAA